MQNSQRSKFFDPTDPEHTQAQDSPLDRRALQKQQDEVAAAAGDENDPPIAPHDGRDDYQD